MPVASASVAAGADDADENESSGAVDVTDTVVNSQAGATAAARVWAAFRFAVSGITQYSKITSATIGIDFDKATRDIDVDIHCELAASPAQFTTGTNNIQNRSRTTASVTWTDTDLGTPPVSSPDFTAVVQEVVNSFTPTYIVVILKPRSGTSNFVPIAAYEHATLAPALLNILYNPRQRVHIYSTP